MKLVILDRDGVINRDSRAYIKSPAEWKALPGSLEAIARLHQAGFIVVVATNQSGVSRGLFDHQTLAATMRKMHDAVQAEGGDIAAVFYCPHSPDDECTCRKPKSGLFEQIKRRFETELEDVPAIGDSLRDLEAASIAGARPILVRTGNGAKTESKLPPGSDVEVFDTLLDAANALSADE
ncbi:MAG: D-glycero-beta-D-manno-heptose 1,7-bisphosphate 7-phosphatase [Gammaproteobacteria bacterium]